MVIAFAVSALALAQPMLQGRDTTFSVREGTNLSVHNQHGEIIVDAWDRDRVRISADFDDRRGDFTVRERRGVLEVRSRSRRGSGEVEFRITVPRWMAVSAQGTNTEISISGTEGDVEARTTHGDLIIRGGSGFMELTTTNGDVTVTGANGHLNVGTMNGDIDVYDSNGEISIETTNGDITFRRSDATRMDVTTMNGDVEYDGLIDPDGEYSFSTHNGDLTLILDSEASARVTVSTVQGEFDSQCAVRMSRTRSGGRQFEFQIGAGGARVEMESFGGTISLGSRGGCWAP